MRNKCRLYGTGGNHLLAQVVLVLADRAIPGRNSPVLADKNLLGDLVQETGIG